MKFTKDYMDFGGSVYFHAKIDALPKEKENAFLQHLSMTCRSWTFCRMTARERENLVNSFLWANEQGLIKGDWNARWHTMQALMKDGSAMIKNFLLSFLSAMANGMIAAHKQSFNGF